MNNTIVPAADDTITALAAAVFVASATYDEALKMPNPAAALDDMCDAWAEIAPEVIQVAKASPAQADILRGAVADRLWAYTAVEHSRAEAGDGFGYVFDLLADDLRKGAEPHLTRMTALDVPKRLRDLDEDTAARIEGHVDRIMTALVEAEPEEMA